VAIQFSSNVAKPSGRLLVDWDNQLAPKTGFIATTDPDGVVTLHTRQGISRRIITNIVGRPGKDAFGYGASSVSATISAFTLPPIAVAGATNALTHIHIGRLTAATTAHRVWESYNGSNSTLIGAVLYSGANAFQFTALPVNGSTSAIWLSAAVVSPLERNSFICTHDGVRTNNPQMWINGQSVSVTNTAAGSGTIQAYRSTDGFFLAQRQNPKDRGWTGNVEFLYLDFVQRAADEVLKIERDPWQLFRKPRRIWVPVSAGTGVTYNFSASGSVAFSGAAPLTRGWVFLPSGVVVFSGTSPFTATGVANYTFTTSGSFTLSGASPASRGRVLLPSGAVAFSGSAPFSSGASTSYTFSTSGNFSLSGASLMARSRVFSPSGSITFSGTALWRKGWVYPASGQVQFFGTANMYFTSGLSSGLVDRMLKGMGK